jgi:exonuclease SbcC
MKILSLKARNINSLKGDIHIDFQKLTKTGSLFAIVGPTGSGKSTILDIISCALYGRTFRLKNPNDLMSRHTFEAYCEVEFEVKGRYYRSSWAQKRARKNPDGKFQTAKMELVDLKDEKIFPLKSREVPKKVEELSGLDFSRFAQSMLLAQGGFDAFLKADEKERSALLEKMTGTQIYADISIYVFEKHKEIKSDIDSKEKVLDAIEVLDKNSFELKQKFLEDTIKDKKQTDTLLDILIEYTNIQKTLDEDILSLKILQEKSKNIEDVIKKAQKEYEKIKDEFDIASKDFNSNNEKIKNARKFEIRYKEMQKALDRLENQYDTKENLLKSYGEKLSYIDKNHIEISKQIEKNQSYLNDNLKNESFLKKQQHIQQELQKIQILKREFVNYKKLMQQTLRYKNEISELEEFLEVFLANKKSLQTYVDDLKKHIETLRLKYEQEQLLQKYELDRQMLKESQECFLCGSTHHPYLLKAPEVFLNKTKDDIDNSLAKLQMQEKEYQEICSKIDISNTKKQSASLELKKTQKELLDVEMFFKKEGVLPQNIDEESFKNKITSLLDELEKLNKLQQQQVDLQEKLTSCTIEQKQMQSKKDDLTKELLEMKSTKESLDKDIQSLKMQKIQILNVADLDLYEKELFLKYENIQSKHQDIKNRVNELKIKNENFKQQKIILEEKIESKTKQKEHLEEKNTLLKGKEVQSLISFIALCKEKTQALQELVGSLKKELEIYDKNRKTFQQHFEMLKAKKEDLKIWSKLNEMIGSSDGVKFKKFAQGITLEQLITLANKHLNILNSRYILTRNTEKLLELDVIDLYQGNTKRGVITLSGGESFIVSLALALGLSELASKKISIDSLFLDEGFGTLDAESLEMALNALNLLQDSGKMVGVISHVEMLKERIPQQIKVIPQGDGVSSLSC